MAERQNYKLSDRLIKSLCSETPAKATRHGDGDSLYLIHMPNDGIYWVFKYRFQTAKDIRKKDKDYRIGIYKSTSTPFSQTFKPEMSIKEARQERDRLKSLVKQRIDPSEQKKENKLSFNEGDRFITIAEKYIESRSKTTPKNIGKLKNFLNNHIAPLIGDHPIQSITVQDINLTLQAIEKKAIDQGKASSSTAHDCGGFLKSVFDYAINKLNFNITNVAQGRTSALEKHKPKRMPVIEQQYFPELLNRIDNYCIDHPNADVQTMAGLKLIALCFVRTKELRHFEWSEIDYIHHVWRIPAHKMKMGREHIIPLSPQAMSIIESLKPITGHLDYVFYNFSRKKVFSEAWLNQALNLMGYDGKNSANMTGHGFRQLASTGLNELRFDSDMIELQLAHLDETSVKRRYDTSSMLAERQLMMNEWANYLDELRQGKTKSFDLMTPDELIKLKSDRNEASLIVRLRQLKSEGLLEDLLAKI